MKIAFGGKMGTGKDTCVNYLIKKYGGVKISFSDSIYDILYYAQNVCGFKKEKDRKFLQWIGTEWAREKNPNIWIELTLKNYPKNENVYCSDLRFKNEFKSLKDDGWICIKLNKDIKNNKRFGTGDINHISEHDLDTINDDEWDYIIENDGSLLNLYDKLEKIIQKK